MKNLPNPVVLLLAAAFCAYKPAHADNLKWLKKAEGPARPYTVYQAQNMQHTEANRWMFVVYRGCQKLSAKNVIQREKLAANNNIAGGFHCPAPNGQTYVMLKDLTVPDAE